MLVEVKVLDWRIHDGVLMWYRDGAILRLLILIRSTLKFAQREMGKGNNHSS